MSKRLDGGRLVWPAVLERFERHAPAGVMARVALEHALPAGWVDEVFEAHRQRGVVQIRVASKIRKPFIIRVLSISGVTWEWHCLNHARDRHIQPMVERGRMGWQKATG